MNRRSFLIGSSSLLPLPFLESLAHNKSASSSAKRLLILHLNLGIYRDAFIPKKAGPLDSLPDITAPFDSLKNKITILNGLEHKEAGHGHPSVISFTTGRNPNKHDGRFSISVDQRLAEVTGFKTRHDSIAVQCGHGSSMGLSWTRSGTRRRTYNSASQFFDLLYKPGVERKEKNNLHLYRSILDNLKVQRSDLKNKLSKADRIKFDEYQNTIRTLEKKLEKEESWLNTPYPKPLSFPPKPNFSPKNVCEILENMLQLSELAFLTDSTRVITMEVPASQAIISLPGITMGYHSLSHHGKRPDYIKQLITIERKVSQCLADFLNRLNKHELGNGKSLLDETVILLGSGLGNASSHSSINPSLLLAGGGLKHGNYIKYNKTSNDFPLSNLYVSILNHLGVKDTSFADSNGTLPGIF